MSNTFNYHHDPWKALVRLDASPSEEVLPSYSVQFMPINITAMTWPGHDGPRPMRIWVCDDTHCPNCGGYMPLTLSGDKRVHSCDRTAPQDGLPPNLFACPICGGHGAARWGCVGSPQHPHRKTFMRPIHELVRERGAEAGPAPLDWTPEQIEAAAKALCIETRGFASAWDDYTTRPQRVSYSKRARAILVAALAAPTSPRTADRLDHALALLDRARNVIRRNDVRLDADCSGTSPLALEIDSFLAPPVGGEVPPLDETGLCWASGPCDCGKKHKRVAQT